MAGASCRVQVGSSMTAKRSLKTLPRKIYSVLVMIEFGEPAF